MVERAILAWWRNELGASPAIAKEDMPHGGWTETASLQWVDIDETVARSEAEIEALESEQ